MYASRKEDYELGMEFIQSVHCAGLLDMLGASEKLWGTPWPTEFNSFGDFVHVTLLLFLILNLWNVKKESGFTNRV
jgi:hypothetical protein